MRRMLCAVTVGLLITFTSAFGADVGLLALLPPDSKIVGGIYVTRAAASPLGQFLLSQMKEDDANFRRFVMATGFDPRIHLQEVVIGGLTTIGHKGQGVVVARGSFNAAQIAAAAKAEGATTSSYKGVELLQGKGDNGAMAFLEGNIAVMGEIANVQRAIDQRGKTVAIDPKLLAKVNDVSSRFDAWMVSNAPVSSMAPSTPNQQANSALQSPALQGIEQTSGGLRFGNVVEFVGEALTRSDKDAQALVDVVRFIASMVQMQQERNPEAAKFAKMIDSLEVKALASTVHLTLSIPQNAIEELIKSKKTTVKRAAAK